MFLSSAFAAGESGLEIDWERTGSYRSDCIPHIDKYGNCYYISNDGKLYSIAPDKLLNWSVDLHQVCEGLEYYGGAGIVSDENGNVYAGSMDGKVYAITNEGDIKWTFDMDVEVAESNSPVLASDGTLYIVSQNGTLYALDKEDGSEKWQFKINDRAFISPALAPDGTIYVGSFQNVSAVNPDGTLKWKKCLSNLSMDTGIDYLYIATAGTSTWTKHTSRLGLGNDGTVIVRTFVGHDGEVFDTENVLYALAPEDGSEKWHMAIDDVSSPITWENNVYFLSGRFNSTQKLYAINIEDGKECWNYDIAYGAHLYGDEQPVIGQDGTIYVGFATEELKLFSSQGDMKDSIETGRTITGISNVGPEGEIFCCESGIVVARIIDHNYQQVPESLEIEDESILMLTGGEYDLPIKLLDAFDKPINISALTFESSSDAVTVNHGLISAIAPGTAEITVFCTENPEISESIQVEVRNPASGMYLEITPTDAQVNMEEILELEAQLFTSDGERISGEEIVWTSSDETKAKIDDAGKVTGISEGTVNITAQVKDYLEVEKVIDLNVSGIQIEKVTLGEVIFKTMRTVGWFYNQGIPSDWGIFGLNAAGEDITGITDDQGKKYWDNYTKLKTGAQMTDYCRRAIAVVSAGGDPSNADGQNLIEEIYNYPSLSQGINAPIWGLIALDAANAEIPDNAVHSRASLIQNILQNKSGDGWAFGGGDKPDPDMTGMALYALAPYRDNPAVKAAGEKAIAWLSNAQYEDGTMASWGSKNCCSVAQTIMGITAWGVDPQGALFTKKKGNLATALINYHVDSGADAGMFKFTSAPDPCFATDQGLEAMVALKEFMMKAENGVANPASTIWYKIHYAGTNVGDISALEIIPDGLEVMRGKTITLSAVDQEGHAVNNGALSWSSSDPSVADVTAEGQLTTYQPGIVNVTVSLNDDPETADIDESLITDSSQITVVGEEFEVTKAAGSSAYPVDKYLSYEVKNLTDTKKSAVFIVTLLNQETKEMIRQSYVEREYAPHETHKLDSGFELPDTGEYMVKVMLWNSFFKGRPYIDTIVE